MTFDNPNINNPELLAFADLAERFCTLIESRREIESVSFTHRLQLLLPEVYAAGLRLPSTEVLFNDDGDDRITTDVGAGNSRDDPDRADQAGLAELFNDLAGIFGKFTYYREVYDPFDPVEGNPEVMGNLADDVSDIYSDIYPGVLKWRRGESGGALWEWRFGLEHHWGEHATGAIRALHCRAAWWDIGWPPCGGLTDG